METWTPFVLPALFAMQIGIGLARLVSPHRRLRRLKAMALRKGGHLADAKALMGRPAREALKPEDAARLDRVRLGGLGRMTIGVLGAWATGLTLGWVGWQTEFWSDGDASVASLVDEECRRFMKEGGGVGLAVGAVLGTNEAIVTYGRGQMAYSERVKADTLFEIGSVTKTFTGLGLAMAVQDGTMALEGEVRHWLPDAWEMPEAGRAVTLEQLATHTSGFPRLPGNMPWWRGMLYGFLGGDPYRGYSVERLKEAVRTVTLRSKPGQGWEYSNFAVGLLGYALARRHGTDWESYMRAAIGDPLGLKDTRVTLTEEQVSRFARGYRALARCGPVTLGLRAAPWELSDALAGAGGLRSTIRDMTLYLRANMHPAEDAMGRAMRLAQEARHRRDAKHATGLNWARRHFEESGTAMVWHNGGTGGFSSFLGFAEDGSAGVVVLSNTSRKVDALAVAILQRLIGSSQEGAKASGGNPVTAAFERGE